MLLLFFPFLQLFYPCRVDWLIVVVSPDAYTLVRDVRARRVFVVPCSHPRYCGVGWFVGVPIFGGDHERV
jgi:hypothetical protein